MTIGEAVGAPKMVKIGRGTACHKRGTACHDFCNPLKTRANSTVSNFDPQNAEKCFIYKALEATGSLLRQVCKILREGAFHAVRPRSSVRPANGCGCGRRLPTLMCQVLTITTVMVAPCPSSAEAWQSGSSFSKTDARSVPGEGSSFLQASAQVEGSSFAGASATSNFDLKPAKSARPGSAFIMPADRDEFVRLRALISHAESRRLGYDDYHGSGGAAQIPPPKRPRDMSISEIFAWVQSSPGQQHAIGRYQIIPSTLTRLVDRAGIALETRFDEKIQDALANLLILDAGYIELKEGKKPLAAFMDDVARIWAGFPLASGLSAYNGTAGNKATVSREFYSEQMAQIFPAEAERSRSATRVAAK